MRKRCELAYLLGGDDSSELPDLIAAAQDSLPFSHQSLIAVGTEIPVKQENTWVKQECVAKYTPGNFGWMDVGDPKDCQVELPSTIPDPLWVVGQQSALNIVNGLGCTENLITGTIYVLVFDEGVGPINNSTPAPAGCAGVNGDDCFKARFVLEIDVTGINAQGVTKNGPNAWSSAGCSLVDEWNDLSPAEKASYGFGSQNYNPDCLQGKITDVLTLPETNEATKQVQLFLPLPNS